VHEEPLAGLPPTGRKIHKVEQDELLEAV